MRVPTSPKKSHSSARRLIVARSVERSYRRGLLNGHDAVLWQSGVPAVREAARTSKLDAYIPFILETFARFRRCAQVGCIGDSYRFKEAQEAAAAKAVQRATRRKKR
jgi:hypothetical protein